MLLSGNEKYLELYFGSEFSVFMLATLFTFPFPPSSPKAGNKPHVYLNLFRLRLLKLHEAIPL